MSGALGSRRARLIAFMLVATAAISVLAFQAAGSSVSYYLEPREYLADPALDGTRVRVAGRVVGDTIVEHAGRPVAFEIVGDFDDRMLVRFDDGVVPNLFGPFALVIAEGRGVEGGIEASSLIIKHEDEFWSEMPPAESISSHFVPSAEEGEGDGGAKNASNEKDRGY
ncbi:MAG: cytochrome c maturation protein CcmE [Chloroflexi bacterium]|nr:cytochrome c maturation protein CcmE [Chloroflexota bacterium]MQC48095.1 cytochrome c maturation protein CcmE [Chloroflexota bacterium]